MKYRQEITSLQVTVIEVGGAFSNRTSYSQSRTLWRMKPQFSVAGAGQTVHSGSTLRDPESHNHLAPNLLGRRPCSQERWFFGSSANLSECTEHVWFWGPPGFLGAGQEERRRVNCFLLPLVLLDFPCPAHFPLTGCENSWLRACGHRVQISFRVGAR